MPDPTPRIEPQAAPDGARLLVLGQWTASRLAERHLLRSLEGKPDASGAATWDLNGARLDHIGAQWLWDHWGQRWPE